MKNKIISVGIVVAIMVVVSVVSRNWWSHHSDFSMKTVCLFVWEADQDKSGDGLKKTVVNDGQVLQVEYSGGGKSEAGQKFKLGRLDLIDPLTGKSQVATKRFAVVGQVKYERLGGWYFETWFELANAKGETGSYFTKGLVNGGLLGKLQGSSDWRDFVLPFDASDKIKDWSLKELSLYIDVVNNGTVLLRNVRLMEFDGLPKGLDWAYAVQYSNNIKELTLALSKKQSSWWPLSWGGWIGSICGVFLGLVGGLLGMLMKMEKGWKFVLVSLWVLSVIGVISLVMGLLALALGQPYDIYFTLLLVGGISVLVWPANLWQFLQRRHQYELRRMASLDG